MQTQQDTSAEQAAVARLVAGLDGTVIAERDANGMGPAQLVGFNAIGDFLFAGKAIVTLCSKKTGSRFTYKVSHKQGGDCSFVGLLTGADNERDYSYLGMLPDNPATALRGVGTGKSCAKADAPSARAFQHLLDVVWGKVDGAMLEVWHEGRCGRCGRKLTVPESLAIGLGPECASKR